MTKEQKILDLKDFRKRGVDKAIIEKAKEEKGEKIPFVLMGINCFFEIRDCPLDDDSDECEEVANNGFEEKFFIGLDLDSVDFSMGTTTENGIDLLVGLFFSIGHYISTITSFSEGYKDKWLLSNERFLLISSFLALRDFLTKEGSIALKTPPKTEKQYRKNGEIALEIERVDNETSFARSFFFNGDTSGEWLLFNGERTGIAKYYRETGILHQKICFNKEQKVWGEEYDWEGRLIDKNKK